MAERQTADVLEDIRYDHIARYMWARNYVAGRDVIDIGCGVGYGASIMSEVARSVYAIDNSMEAIEYAMLKWDRQNIKWRVSDASEPTGRRFDVSVCFEVIEHLQRPMDLLRRARAHSRALLISAPNEEGCPYSSRHFPYHVRHYRKHEMEDMLNECGWYIDRVFHQAGKDSSVDDGFRSSARTLVYVAE